MSRRLFALATRWLKLKVWLRAEDCQLVERRSLGHEREIAQVLAAFYYQLAAVLML